MSEQFNLNYQSKLLVSKPDNITLTWNVFLQNFTVLHLILKFNQHKIICNTYNFTMHWKVSQVYISLVSIWINVIFSRFQKEILNLY